LKDGSLFCECFQSVLIYAINFILSLLRYSQSILYILLQKVMKLDCSCAPYVSLSFFRRRMGRGIRLLENKR
jgi:hypothetical protein